MRSYKQEVLTIQNMLEKFVDSGKIEAKNLDLMDNIIRWSEEDQIKVLNNSYLPLHAQRSFFGAIRNMNITLKKMKERLKGASSSHENPTSAELCIEILPSLSNLAPYIDSLMNQNALPTEFKNVLEFSRILYKKATNLGFSQDVASQLKEAGITSSQIESFLDRFNKNVALELEIEEEVSSSNENSN